MTYDNSRIAGTDKRCRIHEAKKSVVETGAWQVRDIADRAAARSDEYRKMGYHCSEACIRAVAEALNIELTPDILKISSGFRGGGGGYRERCGALEVGIMLISFKYGRTEAETDASPYSYLIRILHERFLEGLGSFTCRVLKPFSQRITPDKSCSYVIKEGARIVTMLLMEADRLISQMPEEESGK